jgi:hypothetical protein
MMKLKINKNYTKELETKIKNQNNKEWNSNDKNKLGCNFQGELEKKKIHLQQTEISWHFQ